MTTRTSKTKKGRSVVSIHTKPQTSRRLSDLANATGKTRSALANDALESFLDHQEWVEKEIQKGLADVKTGKVIEQADMIAWAKDLKTERT